MEIFLLICIILGYITNIIWLYENKPNTYFISSIQLIVVSWVVSEAIGILTICLVFLILIGYMFKNYKLK